LKAREEWGSLRSGFFAALVVVRLTLNLPCAEAKGFMYIQFGGCCGAKCDGATAGPDGYFWRGKFRWRVMLQGATMRPLLGVPRGDV